MELHPLRLRRFLDLAHVVLGIRIVGVHEQGDQPGLGNQLGKQLEPLGCQVASEGADAGDVAARAGETGIETAQDRVADEGDDRDRRGGIFRRSCPSGARRDQIDLAPDEIGGQCGQPIVLILCPAVFDRHVLSLDVAGFAQPLAKRGHVRCSRTRRANDEVADHRHRLLLRAKGARCRHRTAQQQHQLAASHSMTSSAEATSWIEWPRSMIIRPGPLGDDTFAQKKAAFRAALKLPGLRCMLCGARVERRSKGAGLATRPEPKWVGAKMPATSTFARTQLQTGCRSSGR